MDDRTARLMRQEIVEDMASGPEMPLVDALARYLSDESLDKLTEDIARHRSDFTAPLTRDAALALFDLPPGFGASDLLAQVFLGGEADWLAQVAQILTTGKATDIKDARRLSALRLADPSLSSLAGLEEILLTGGSAKEPFTAKIGKFPTKDCQAALGPLLPHLENLMARVESARAPRIALLAAEKTLTLHNFARAFLPEFERRKGLRGWLDFDDLILKARALLTDPSVAQWVLFRLDGGIDHILVDEAQDTSPTQWQVIELLAQEITAGLGARDRPRTIFVVGDKKQSIYSFQGADLRAFDQMRGHFRERLQAVQVQLTDLTLDHSFRSSPAILRLVDLTFDERRGAGLGGEVKHLAFRDTMPGRVDLWPHGRTGRRSGTRRLVRTGRQHFRPAPHRPPRGPDRVRDPPPDRPWHLHPGQGRPAPDDRGRRADPGPAPL